MAYQNTWGYNQGGNTLRALGNLLTKASSMQKQTALEDLMRQKLGSSYPPTPEYGLKQPMDVEGASSPFDVNKPPKYTPSDMSAETVTGYKDPLEDVDIGGLKTLWAMQNVKKPTPAGGTPLWKLQADILQKQKQDLETDVLMGTPGAKQKSDTYQKAIDELSTHGTLSPGTAQRINNINTPQDRLNLGIK